tara:strand:- start:894 stop:1055 length:162 start_codon:yes stop_codon:yes gene_type:complete
MTNPTQKLAADLNLTEVEVNDLLEDWAGAAVPDFDTWNDLVTEFTEEVFAEGW